MRRRLVIASLAVVLFLFLMPTVFQTVNLSFKLPSLLISDALSPSPVINLTTNAACNTASTCTTGSITTSSNELDIVACQTSGTNEGLKITDSKSDTFTNRTAVKTANQPNFATAYFVDTNPSAKTFTCTQSSGSNNIRMTIVVISGQDSTPFDSSAPCTAVQGTGTLASCLLSTSNPNDLILGMSGVMGGVTQTAATGFTIAVQNAGSAIENKSVSTTQTNLNVSITWTGSNPWSFVADAVKGLTTVTQPIKATLNTLFGGTTQTITVSGCSPSPLTFSGDGASHNINMTDSCSFSLTIPSRYYWTTSNSGTSCASGTCSLFSATYRQLPQNTSWYKFETLHGIANSINITEPSYTFQVANGTGFTIDGHADPFALNYTRVPNEDVCSEGYGAIGKPCLWSETIACGCGNDQGTSGPETRTWDVIFADANVLELQYNNTYTGTNPRDNYTLVFYKGTNWFSWKVDQVIVSGRAGYYTGWNGYDEAWDWAFSSAYGSGYCLTASGSIASVGCTVSFSKTAEASLHEYQFVGETNTSGTSNSSVFLYPISSSVPYGMCSAGTNGEMKCEQVPTGSPSGGNGGPLTFTAGWYTSETFAIYPTYNDFRNVTVAKNLAKQLYYSQYGNSIGYSNWKFPSWCNPANSGGATSQGCVSANGVAGVVSLGNNISGVGKGYNAFQFGFYNQSSMQLGYNYESGTGTSAQDTFSPSLGQGDTAVMAQNVVTNGTGTFNTNFATLSAASFLQKNVSNNLEAISMENLKDVKGNTTVISPPNVNYYLVEFNSTIIASTAITTLTYAISYPTASWLPYETSTAYIRTINSTTVDLEYKDSVYGNWIGFVVGEYGANNHNATAGTGIKFGLSYNSRGYMRIYLINNTSPLSYTSGSYEFGMYVLPHFGNITTVAQIDSYMTKSITMSSEKQMYQKPINLANVSEPLALQASQSQIQSIFANTTATGYAVLSKLSATTYYFLWNSTVTGKNLTSISSSIVSSYSKSEIGSTDVWNVTITVNSTAYALINFNDAALTVDLSIQLSTTHGATNATFAVSGTTSGISIVSNGIANSSFRANSGATITITRATNYLFNSSCSAGGSTCTFTASNTTFILTAYLQKGTTLQTTAKLQTLFDNSITIAVTGTDRGASATATITCTASSTCSTTHDFDYGTKATFPSTSGANLVGARWTTFAIAGTLGTNQSAAITTNGTINENYYRQDYIRNDYAITGGGSPTTPTLAYNFLTSAISGKTMNTTLYALWVDVGTNLVASPNPLSPSSTSERWIGNTTSYAPSAELNQTWTYNHQYYLTLSNSPSAGGTLNATASFYNSGNSFRITATPTSPNTFTSWSGNYTGTNPTTALLNFTAPNIETANWNILNSGYSGIPACTPQFNWCHTDFTSTTIPNQYINSQTSLESSTIGIMLIIVALVSAVIVFFPKKKSLASRLKL